MSVHTRTRERVSNAKGAHVLGCGVESGLGLFSLGDVNEERLHIAVLSADRLDEEHRLDNPSRQSNGVRRLYLKLLRKTSLFEVVPEHGSMCASMLRFEQSAEEAYGSRLIANFR